MSKDPIHQVDYEALKKLLDKHPLEGYNYNQPGKLPPSVDLSGWETTLTDPREHSLDHFRYLVHAVSIQGSMPNLIQQQFLIEEMIRDPSGIKYINIDLLCNPEKIAEKPVISASLIDAEHRETWKAGGYILRVPVENILKTCGEDCATYFVKSEETRAKLEQERKLYGVANPDVVLAYPSSRYNEIVLAGTGSTGKSVEISGIFVKIFPDGELVDEELEQKLKSITYQRGLPVVRIQEPVYPYIDSAPNIFKEDRAFGINKDGVRYIFHTEHSSFQIAQWGGKKSRAMTRFERTKMVGLVREYLAITPNETLQTLLTQAEQVPDEALQRRVDEEGSYKQKIRDPYGFDKIRIFEHYIKIDIKK